MYLASAGKSRLKAVLTVAICFVPLLAVIFPASASAAAASAGKDQASAAAGFFFNVRTPAALIAAGALKDAFVLSGTSPILELVIDVLPRSRSWTATARARQDGHKKPKYTNEVRQSGRLRY